MKPANTAVKKIMKGLWFGLKTESPQARRVDKKRVRRANRRAAHEMEKLEISEVARLREDKERHHAFAESLVWDTELKARVADLEVALRNCAIAASGGRVEQIARIVESALAATSRESKTWYFVYDHHGFVFAAFPERYLAKSYIDDMPWKIDERVMTTSSLPRSMMKRLHTG
jgi:hypothetical protein